jgi:hypothetical protein
MVRSPALVFQEMAIKGAEGARRRLSNTPSQRPKPSSSLVDYGDEEDELMSPTPDEKTADAPSSEASTDKPLPVTPDKNRLLSPTPDDSVSTSLGSPFQSIMGPLSPSLEAEKPVLSLRSLGEKRRREEEEEDVLLSKSSKAAKGKNGSSSSKPSSNGIGSKLKINLKSALLGGDKK